MSKRARGKALDSNTSTPQSSTFNALNAQLISPVSLLVSAGDSSITNNHHHASAPFAFTHLNAKSRDTLLEEYVLKSRGYRYCDPWNGAGDEEVGADHAPHVKTERPVAGGASKVQTRAKRAREEEGSGPAQPDLSSLTNRRVGGRRTEASVASTTAESLLTVSALLHHDTLTVNSRKTRKSKGSDNIKQEEHPVSDASDMGDDTIDRGSVAEPSPVFGLESEGGTPAGSNRSRSASVSTTVVASSSLAIGKQQPIRRRGGVGQLDSSARDSVGSVAQSVVTEEAKPIPRTTNIVDKAATATAAQPLPNPNILLQLQAHVRQKAMYRLQIAEAAQVVTAPISYKDKATAISAIETLSTAMIGQPEQSRHLAQRQQRVLTLVSALMGAGEEATPQQTDQSTREILKDPLSVATKHLSLPSLFAKPQPVDSLMSEDEAAKFMRYAFTAGRVRREVPDPYTFLEGKAAALRTELRAAYDAQQTLSAKQIATKLGDIARQCTSHTTGEESAKPIAVVPTVSLGKEKKQIRTKK